MLRGEDPRGDAGAGRGTFRSRRGLRRMKSSVVSAVAASYFLSACTDGGGGAAAVCSIHRRAWRGNAPSAYSFEDLCSSGRRVWRGNSKKQREG